ncbi:MAG: elongation factor 1-beta [archaeon]
MADVIATIRIMPDSPETPLDKIEEDAKKLIEADKSIVHKTERKPVAFGLNSIDIMFTRDESLGSFDELEKSISDMENVSSVETIDVRRAIG